MLATASTLAVIAVFDAVSISLMEEKQFTKEHFYRIHPGAGWENGWPRGNDSE